MFLTAEQLITKKTVHTRDLHSDHMMDFYSKYLENKVFIYKLQDKTQIKVMFDKEQFFHLTGFHYFFKNLKGLDGWKYLVKNPKNIGKLNFRQSDEAARVLNRIKYFNAIPKILQQGELTRYVKEDFPMHRSGSDFFIHLKHDGRCLKLGLIKNNSGIYYPHTFLVDLDKPKYNMIVDSKYKCSELKRFTMSKEDFFKSNIKEKIIYMYKKECPSIEYIKTSTAVKINDINKQRGTPMTYKQMKKEYRQLGQLLESKDDILTVKMFKDLGSIIDDIKHTQMIKRNEVLPSTAKSIDLNL